MRLSFLLTSLLLLACFQPAIGQERQNLDANKILSQQQQIRADAEARKGRYKDMKVFARDQLFANQDVVNRLLQGKNYTTDLPEHEQVAVFNALESIEAIVNDAEEQRMVCERHKPTGSHRPKTLCKTVAQRRADQEAGKDAITQRDQRL